MLCQQKAFHVPARANELTRVHRPRNIRELQNLIERALILSKGMLLDFPDLDKPVMLQSNLTAGTAGKPMTMQEMEIAHITMVLKSVNGKISGEGGASEILNIHPNTLRSRMKKLNSPYATGKTG